MNLDLKQFERFEKQIILKKIGINGQKKIFKSKVLIIGIGGTRLSFAHIPSSIWRWNYRDRRSR